MKKKLMKLAAILLTATLFFAVCGCSDSSWYYDYTDADQEFNSKLFYQNDRSLSGADPYILVADGYYYLYITGNTYIPAYRSTNLTDWQELGPVFTPARDAWSVHNLWAPEVVAKDGKYYMYYSGRNAYTGKMGIGVAVADNPAGPFAEIDTTAEGGSIDRTVMPFDFGFTMIDPNVFIDEDGKIYMYFSKDQVDQISKICVAELDEDMVTVKEGTLREDIIEPEQQWENPDSLPRWNEAPEMMKHNGKYYLMYSANYYQSRYYSVGVAVSDSPVEGFEKVAYNPILAVDSEWEFTSGTGHNCWFWSIDGKELFVAYHSHADTVDGGTSRVINFDRALFDGERLVINGPTTSPQPLPSGASEYTNLASQAKITVNGQETAQLSDNIINFLWSESKDSELVLNKKAKIVLKFEKEVEVTAVMICDSADYALCVDDVEKIDLGDRTITDLKMSPSMRYVDEYDYEVKIPGSAFIAEFSPVRTSEITITISEEGEFALNEIVILGK